VFTQILRFRTASVDRGRTTTRMIDAVGPRTLPKQIPQRPQDRPYLPPVGDCRLRVPPCVGLRPASPPTLYSLASLWLAHRTRV
jgi:hypothetical protein